MMEGTENKPEFATIKLCTINPMQAERINFVNRLGAQSLRHSLKTNCPSQSKSIYNLSECLRPGALGDVLIRKKILDKEAVSVIEINDLEKAIVLTSKQAPSPHPLRDKKKSTKSVARSKFQTSFTQKKGLEPIVATKKQCHFRYYLQELDIAQERLLLLSKVPSALETRKSFQQYRRGMYAKLSTDQRPQSKQQPQLLLPSIKNSVYFSENKPRNKKTRLFKSDPKVFRCDTPWNQEQESSLLPSSLSKPTKL